MFGRFLTLVIPREASVPDNLFGPLFPDGCPPDDARNAEGVVFRIVVGAVFDPDDFKSHAELNKARGAPPCARCGVSVYDSLVNACHRLRISPHLGSAIAEGELEAATGRLSAPNRQGHMEWWPYQISPPIVRATSRSPHHAHKCAWP
jgi:hypothetical protein